VTATIMSSVTTGKLEYLVKQKATTGINSGLPQLLLQNTTRTKEVIN